jgi:hypothetical protein
VLLREYPALGMLIDFMGESTIFMSLNLLFSPAILVCKVQNAKIAILVTEKSNEIFNNGTYL